MDTPFLLDLITTISTNFINLAPDEIDTGIERALQAIGEFTGVDRSYVFLFEDELRPQQHTYEWCAPGVASQQNRLHDLPPPALPWFAGRLQQREIVHVPQVAALPREAGAERAECQIQEIKSLILVPLALRETLVGFLGLDMVRAEKQWSSEDMTLLTIVGEIFVNALARKQAEAALARRDAILEAVRFAAECFLMQATTASWPQNVRDVLERLGRTTGVDRVSIFKQRPPPAAPLFTHLRYVWEADQGATQGPLAPMDEFALEALGLGRWAQELRQGRMLYGPTHSFPERERAWLEAAGIRSVAVAPVFVGPRWWGFIQFDACQSPRTWTTTEVEALQAAASTFGAGIQHKHTAEALRERETLYRNIFEATSDALIINSFDGTVVEANPAAYGMHGYTHEEFIGLSPLVFIHPKYHALFADFLETIQAGGVYRAQAVDLRKDGTSLHVEVQGMGIIYQGQPHILSLVRDITDRVQAYQLLEQRVEERTRELATLLEVSNSLAATLELAPLVSLILDHLKAVADYNGASVYLLTGGELRVLDYRGPLPRDLVLSLRYPVVQLGPIWHEVGNQNPVIIDDIRGEAPLAHAYQTVVGERLNTVFDYIHNWMGVPLVVNDRVIGMLVLTHGEPNYYTPRHAALAMAIANQASVAIENARLYERSQQVAVLEERQRLARELHDSVSQAIFSISLTARTARTLLDRDPAQAAQPLQYISTLAQGAMAEMRALIFELRPESLANEGLVAALQKQAAALQARHEIEVTTVLGEEPDLPLETKEAFYRVAQEAMHNTVKHARATQVSLRLTLTEQRVVLEVGDNGVGFDTRRSFPGHLGLHSMRERMARLGGTLHLESSPGVGTCIHAVLPR